MRLLPGILLAATALAEEPLRLALPESGPPAAVHYWYGLYAAAEKVGWAHITTGITEGGALVEELRFEFRGKQRECRSFQQIEFDPTPPYALLRATTGWDEHRVTIERARKGYRVAFSGFESDLRRDVPDLDYTYGDAWTRAEFFRRGPRKGDSLVVRRLDIDDVRIDLCTMRVDEIHDVVLHGVRTQCYRGRISSAEGDTDSYATLANGGPAQLTLATVLEAHLEDEETAKRIEPSLAVAVPIDRKLGDATGVTRLVLEVTGIGAPWIATGPRQAVELREDGVRVVKLGVTTEAPATDAEIRDALAATDEYPARDARVAALARKAIAGAATPAEKVRRLVLFVSDYVEDDVSAPDPEGALDVVGTRRGDCTAHTKLFTALARAAGIPARCVSGLAYMGDEAKAFGGHAWNEVALERAWVPVDPTWNEVELSATHIMISADREFNELWVPSRLELRLVAFERKP